MFSLSKNPDLYMRYEDFPVVCASVLKRFVCLPAGGFFFSFFFSASCCTDLHWQRDAGYVRRDELAVFNRQTNTDASIYIAVICDVP